jgi:hypothetical protein
MAERAGLEHPALGPVNRKFPSIRFPAKFAAREKQRRDRDYYVGVVAATSFGD